MNEREPAPEAERKPVAKKPIRRSILPRQPSDAEIEQFIAALTGEDHAPQSNRCRDGARD